LTKSDLLTQRWARLFDMYGYFVILPYTFFSFLNYYVN